MSTNFRVPQRTSPPILLADDEPEIREYVKTALACRGYSVEAVSDGEEALESLQSGANFSLVLLDLFMPRKNGLEALQAIRQADPKLPVVMLSCAASATNVVEAMKSGANDFLVKPISHEDLGAAVDKVLADTLESPPNDLGRPSQAGSRSSAIVPVREIEPVLRAIGSSSISVLIQGETGAGKEVIARRLHEQSTRSGRAFLKLNCAALPSELVESELFGYERGAFTGAFQRKPGMFELADGGTILLDEIGDMDFRLQAKLLQVLQDSEFQRVGGKQPIHVDVRVIAATHCNLRQAIAEKRFRADLYYRLNVVSILVPPLRERKDEILPLVRVLLQKHSKGDAPVVTQRLQDALVEYDWPGNIRELENLVRRFVVLRDTELIISDLQPARKGGDALPRRETGVPFESPESVSACSSLRIVDEARKGAETQTIVAALTATRWNRKKAAHALGIDYKALLYKMKKLGISADPN